MDTINWENAADCLRILAHPHRLKAVALLLENEYSVGALAEACNVLQNVMSEHLNLMKHKQLIKARKRGRNVFYSVEEPALAAIIGCIQKRFVHRE